MEEPQNLWILMGTALGMKRESAFCSAAVRSPLLTQGSEPWKCCWNIVPSQPEVWDTVVHSQSNLKGLVSWQ